MPVSSLIIVGAIVAAFLFFILAVGGAAIWTALPAAPGGTLKKGVSDEL